MSEERISRERPFLDLYEQLGIWVRDGAKFALELARNVAIAALVYVASYRLRSDALLDLANVLRQLVFLWAAASISVALAAVMKPWMRKIVGHAPLGFMDVGLFGLTLGVSYLIVGGFFNEVVFSLVESEFRGGL